MSASSQRGEGPHGSRKQNTKAVMVGALYLASRRPGGPDLNHDKVPITCC